MKFFPIKISILCLLITPVLYILTVSASEKYLNHTYTSKVQNILIGETKPLLEGQVPIEERITENIISFKKSDPLINRFNIEADILVSIESGRIIYPIYSNTDSAVHAFSKENNQQEIAKHNFEILNSGLNVSLDIHINHGSPISLIILFIYLILSTLIFFIFYRKGSIKFAIEREEKKDLISQLQSREKTQQAKLAELSEERIDLFKDIEALNNKYQKNKARAKENEEDLFDEIISLENKLNSFIELKQDKDQEIDQLKSQIKKYERRKGSKTKRVDYDFISKRFGALYKNITMHRKALSGFLNLNDDQQIKAEEIILMLDRSTDKVTIKRKVFSGKKHRHASFEVLFAYNGRLYFDKDDNNKTRVLVIGTKNTQQKDMDFLHSL